MIINTDRSDKEGIHWCSNLDLHPKSSLGFKGVQNFKENDNIISLVSVKFSILNYEKLNNKEISNLSTTTIDLFN